MKLTEQDINDLESMADWLDYKADENWDGFDDDQIRWFKNNASLIRSLVKEVK